MNRLHVPTAGLFVNAACSQLLFALRGASHEMVRRTTEDGLLILRGVTPEEMHNLVAEAMEPALRPLVYAEPLRLVEQQRAALEAAVRRQLCQLSATGGAA